MNWSRPGLLDMDQKEAKHYILDESHFGKLQCILEKIVLKEEVKEQ